MEGARLEMLFVFATNMDLKPRKIRKMFRKRWGIDTSYRMMNKFLARTTSKLYAVRKLYFYLTILLYNIWVMLNRSEGKITADSLKLYAILSLIPSFIPKIEEAG